MGELEDIARARIKELYGSVPKMAEAVGMPPTTIYHALDRGFDNTRTETSNRIKEALFGNPIHTSRNVLTDDELELVNHYRKANRFGKEQLLKMAEAIEVSFSED